MPAGLDGCPDPLVSDARNGVLAAVAGLIATTAARRERTCIAIDGRAGVGKSTFADELSGRLGSLGVATLRSTTDSFHRPRAERMRLGQSSAEGYYLDSHQLSVIVDELLVPFSGGAPTVRVAAFDEPTDSAVHQLAEVTGQTVLVFDGLFLQRPELSRFWDHVVFLTAETRLDERWLSFLFADLPTDPSSSAAVLDDRLRQARWPRYRHGWTHYLTTDRPTERADVVIDNEDLTAPHIVAWRN